MSKKQTPLEQLIEFIDNEIFDHAVKLNRYPNNKIGKIKLKCIELLPLEKEREQKIASDAWDACEKIF